MSELAHNLIRKKLMTPTRTPSYSPNHTCINYYHFKSQHGADQLDLGRHRPIVVKVHTKVYFRRKSLILDRLNLNSKGLRIVKPNKVTRKLRSETRCQAKLKSGKLLHERKSTGQLK